MGMEAAFVVFRAFFAHPLILFASFVVLFLLMVLIVLSALIILQHLLDLLLQGSLVFCRLLSFGHPLLKELNQLLFDALILFTELAGHLLLKVLAGVV